MSEAPKATVKYGIVSDVPESFVNLMKAQGLEAHAELIFYGIAAAVALALAGLVFWALNRKSKPSQQPPSSFDDFRRAVTSSVEDNNSQASAGSTAVFDVVETEVKANGSVVKTEVVGTVTTTKTEPKTPTKPRTINTKDLENYMLKKTPEVSGTRARKAPTVFSPTGDYILTPQSPSKQKSRKSLGNGKN